MDREAELRWLKRGVEIENETGGFCAAGATPYNLYMSDLVGTLRRREMHMPVMDHKTVENVPDEGGWIVGRSLTIDQEEKLGEVLIGAHLYPYRTPDINVWVGRDCNGALHAWAFRADLKNNYPFWVGKVQCR